MSELALLGGTPVRTESWPSWPVHDQRDIDAVSDVVASGRWGGHPYPGPVTAKFARGFEELQGGGHAVAMMNGTITMEVALRAANIGWGDEVLVPAYTFAATATAPVAAGCIPVIVDVDPNTCCIDPKAMEAAITPRTKAVIVVHLAAHMADMDAVMEIAERHNLIVIEDCAHAHGAKWRDRGAGTIGHFGSFSLQSSKTLTTGEGGMLICRTPELAQRAASIIDCGRPKDAEGVEYTYGANFRMSELQAALGVVALERFPEQFREREEMAAYMDESLSEIPGVRVLRQDPRQTARSVFCYVFAIEPEKFGADHFAVCEALLAEGVRCSPGYTPMNEYDLFQPTLSKLPVPTAYPEEVTQKDKVFPGTQRLSDHEAVWLGESTFRAGRKGIDDVAAALRKVHAHAAELVAHRAKASA
jgi:dTDP-4-amino-4,6-dideoxygalactose transaminase